MLFAFSTSPRDRYLLRGYVASFMDANLTMKVISRDDEWEKFFSAHKTPDKKAMSSR